MEKLLTIEEEKSIQLGILAHIDAVCKENNIEYWLDGGTLIGAIRHKGYIPWDDDIDLTVKRKDYKRLLQLLGESTGRFQPLWAYNNETYYYPFAKVVDVGTRLEFEKMEETYESGVFVDIFPLDGLAKDPAKRKKTLERAARCRAVCYFNRFSKTQIKNAGIMDKIKIFISKMIGAKNAIKMLDSLGEATSARYNDYIADMVADPVVVVRGEDFSGTERKTFEGKTYPVPVGYHDYLTTLYGDYMVPPPAEKQVLPHSHKAYRK